MRAEKFQGVEPEMGAVYWWDLSEVTCEDGGCGMGMPIGSLAFYWSACLVWLTATKVRRRRVAA
jgi:hypothetical protein